MSKEKILHTIRQNKPALTVLPSLPPREKLNQDLLPVFTTQARAAKSRVLSLSDLGPLETWIRSQYGDPKKVVSTWSGFKGNVALDEIDQPSDLQEVDLAIITASLGVAENGAVWVSEKEIKFRILPFIAQHLIVVIRADQLVADMLEGYQKIDLADTGFGVFIAGPSKTADIEQSLVVGAQGSRSHTILTRIMH